LTRGRLGSLLLFAAGLVVALGAGELGLRTAGYEKMYDVYSSPEMFWRHDALLGWSLQPNAHGRFVGPRPFPIEFDATIDVNAFGLRGPEIGAKPPGERRVLVLGDSWVAGFEVEYEQTFTALLERSLGSRLRSPVRVINAGVRGYGTDQSYLWFRERGRGLGADLVVAVFSANDFDDNMTLHRSRRPFGKPAFALRGSGTLELVGTPVPAYPPCASWVLGNDYEPVRADGMLSRLACHAQLRLVDHSVLFTFLATSIARVPGVVQALMRLAKPGAEQTPAHFESSVLATPLARSGVPSEAERSRLAGELTTALLQALAREVRSSGARLLLIMAPRHHRYVDVAALRADGVEIESVAMSGSIDPSLIRFRNDSHLNARGHRVFADGLRRPLERVLARRWGG